MEIPIKSLIKRPKTSVTAHFYWFMMSADSWSWVGMSPLALIYCQLLWKSQNRNHDDSSRGFTYIDTNRRAPPVIFSPKTEEKSQPFDKHDTFSTKSPFLITLFVIIYVYQTPQHKKSKTTSCLMPNIMLQVGLKQNYTFFGLFYRWVNRNFSCYLQRPLYYSSWPT